jgi:hypothetical protein
VPTPDLVEDASPEAVPVERERAEPGLRRITLIGAALIVGVPAGIEIARLCTTIVLSLILGH